MTWKEKIQLVAWKGEMADAVELLLEMDQEINIQDDDIRWLRALEAAGVDNWQGYEYAVEIYRGENED